MSRQELYHKVKELGIAKEIEKKFHQNFTRVSNADLESFIKGFGVKKAPSKKVTTSTGNCSKVFIRLVSTLQAKKCLTAYEADEILKLL